MKSDDILMVKLPKETKEALQAKATSLGLSMSSYVKLLINQDLQK